MYDFTGDITDRILALVSVKDPQDQRSAIQDLVREVYGVAYNSGYDDGWDDGYDGH